MTKTPEELTADWKEGKLKSGLYWVNFKEKIVIAECTVFSDVSRPFEIEIKTDFMIKISKVVAPVPTYDEYKAWIFLDTNSPDSFGAFLCNFSF